MDSKNRYASELDWVSQFLIPRLNEACQRMGISEHVEFHDNESIQGTGPKGGTGKADLTARFQGRRSLVVEAKFVKRIGRIERPIDPRDPDVIDQAERYAVKGGFPFYATCNASRLVLFKLDPAMKPFERELASFDYRTRPEWAVHLLELALELRPARFKPVDQALVDALHEAHVDLAPEACASLVDRLRNPQFSRHYREWLESQGLPFADETHVVAADQVAHLWINRILLYSVVQAFLPQRLRPIRIETTEDVASALRKHFGEITRIDYRAAFQPGLSEEIPLTARAEGRLRSLIDFLGFFDFSEFSTDILGRLYERLLPTEERKRLGQFYTPPEIVELILGWSIRSPDDTVLDPCCGSGGFLIGAYRHLMEQKGVRNRPDPRTLVGVHGELLNQVYGLDLNQFAAHLSILNLALQNPIGISNQVNVAVKDFFDTRPGMKVLTGFEGLDMNAQAFDVSIPPTVSCVVGNPPYIRHELLSVAEKTKIQRAIGKGRSLPGQSDIFAYFLGHGISFLNDGGRLGMITSNKWLEVGYGPALQSMLLSTLAIDGIIEFDAGVFPDADVNTLIVLARKEQDPERRNSNLVHFIRLKKVAEPSRVVELLQRSTNVDDDRIRLHPIQQANLKPGKWNTFLREPLIVGRILQEVDFRKLRDCARVFFGVKTGYNDYFILRMEKAREFGIEPEFLVPVIASPKDFPGPILREDEVRDVMFVCHHSKADLRKQGKLGALNYIEYGEKLRVPISRTARRREIPLPEVPSLRSRKVWYSLSVPPAPSIIFPELHDERIRGWWNEARAAARAPLYYCVPTNEHVGRVLAGYLNSSFSQLLLEVRGRSYGGGVLDIKVGEYAGLPCIDPATVSSDLASELFDSFTKLDRAIRNSARVRQTFAPGGRGGKYGLGKQQTLLESERNQALREADHTEAEAQNALDRLVFVTLGFVESRVREFVDGVAKALEEQRTIRRNRRVKGHPILRAEEQHNG